MSCRRAALARPDVFPLSAPFVDQADNFVKRCCNVAAKCQGFCIGREQIGDHDCLHPGVMCRTDSVPRVFQRPTFRRINPKTRRTGQERLRRRLASHIVLFGDDALKPVMQFKFGKVTQGYVTVRPGRDRAGDAAGIKRIKELHDARLQGQLGSSHCFIPVGPGSDEFIDVDKVRQLKREQSSRAAPR